MQGIAESVGFEVNPVRRIGARPEQADFQSQIEQSRTMESGAKLACWYERIACTRRQTGIERKLLKDEDGAVIVLKVSRTDGVTRNRRGRS